MTDAPTLKPSHQFILALLDSKLLLALVSALFGAGGLLSAQMLVAKPEAPKPAQVTERIIERPAAVDLSPLDAKITRLIEEMGKRQPGEPKRPKPLK